MSSNDNDDHKAEFCNILNCIPKNRWIILPFIKKGKLPPSNPNLIRLSETTGISDTILFDLFERFGFAKLKRNTTKKEVMRVLYKSDPLSWNAQSADMKLRIDFEDFAKYKFICFCMNSSSRTHSVQDVMRSKVEYHPLGIRVKPRLSRQVSSQHEYVTDAYA